MNLVWIINFFETWSFFGTKCIPIPSCMLQNENLKRKLWFIELKKKYFFFLYLLSGYRIFFNRIFIRIKTALSGYPKKKILSEFIRLDPSTDRSTNVDHQDILFYLNCLLKFHIFIMMTIEYYKSKFLYSRCSAGSILFYRNVK